jgi:hypothetical protein
LADDIYKTNKDEAAFWYVVGRLRAVQDVKMCKDETARSQVSAYPMMAPNTVTYLLKENDSKYVYNVVLKAIEWDKQHPNRVNPIWSCFHGIEAFSKYPEIIPMGEYKKVQEEARNEMIESAKRLKK